MGRGIPREAEWGIGIGFLVGMVILLILAISTFEGPTSVILLVVAGVFLLVGLFFVTGTQGRSSASDEGGASQQQSIVIGGGGAAEPVRVSQGGSKVLIVCPNCHERVPESARHCPECGHKL